MATAMGRLYTSTRYTVPSKWKAEQRPEYLETTTCEAFAFDEIPRRAAVLGHRHVSYFTPKNWSHAQCDHCGGIGLIESISFSPNQQIDFPLAGDLFHETCDSIALRRTFDALRTW